MMKKYDLIEEYLDELIPNPKCELNYFNDYSLLIAIMLSAQTTDKRVNEVTKVLFSKYDNLDKLSKADIKDLENIIHPLGSFRKKAYNVKEIARIIHNEYNDSVPSDRNILETLPGIGRKTVNVYFSEYLNIPAIAVDTHVERVTKRLGLASINDNVLEIENKLMKNIKKENWSKRHLQLVLFGRYFCKAKNPECDNCKLKDICKYYKKNKI
jgi:endonuclease-3